jgi:hypothetical protein
MSIAYQRARWILSTHDTARALNMDHSAITANGTKEKGNIHHKEADTETVPYERKSISSSSSSIGCGAGTAARRRTDTGGRFRGIPGVRKDGGLDLEYGLRSDGGFAGRIEFCFVRAFIGEGMG